MASGKSVGKNLALAAGSVLLVFLLTLAADHVAGRFSPNPVMPGSMELIFPPNSDQTFETCDFKYTAHIDSLGLRDREFKPEKTNAFRVVAIGDSFTYGWGVEIEQAWVKQLEKNLQAAGLNVEVINAGKPGTGPPFFADIAERIVPLLRPDLVSISMLQGDDFAGAGREGLKADPARDVLDTVKKVYPNFVRLIRMARQARQLATDVQPSTPPQKTTAEDNRRWTENTARDFVKKMTPEQKARFDAFEDKVKEAYLSGRLNPYMIDLAMQNTNFYSITLNLEDPWAKQLIENLSEQFGRIKRVADDYRVPVMVITIPHGPYVNRRAFNNIRRVGYATNDAMLTSDAPDTAVRAACDKAGLPMFSVMQGFREHMNDENLFFEFDGHFTPVAHKLFADLMTPIFTKQIGDAAKKK